MLRSVKQSDLTAYFLYLIGLFGTSTGEDESDYGTSASGKESAPDARDRSQTISTMEPEASNNEGLTSEMRERSETASTIQNEPPVGGRGDDSKPFQEELIQSSIEVQKEQDTNANIIAVNQVDHESDGHIEAESADMEQLSLHEVHNQQFLKPKMTSNICHENIVSNDPYSTAGSASDASDSEGAPVIIQRLKTLDVLEGQDAELVIKVQGNPEPTVRWFKDGIELGNDGRTVVEQDGETWMLTIEGVVLEDDGKYLCKVHNEFGQDTSSAIIYVERKFAVVSFSPLSSVGKFL